MNKSICIALITTMLNGCYTHEQQPAAEAKTAAATPILPNNKIESAEILYYKDPYGDAKRFSRFFTFNTIEDKSELEVISSNITRNYTVRNEVDLCRSEGKIIFNYGKDEYKTIFFATKCDTCCYLYLIKDGAFYYAPLSDSTRTIINRYKGSAKEPDSTH